MALYVKYPKTCRNKKQSDVILTPPDSSLSSSSGSLSSSNSERKTKHRTKVFRSNGYPTVITVPTRKKVRTKKLPSTLTSDSECAHLRNNNTSEEINRNALYSSCKSFYYFKSLKLAAWSEFVWEATWMSVSSRAKSHFFIRSKCRWSSIALLTKMLINFPVA